MKGFVGSVALITGFAVATRALGFIFRIFLSRVLGAEMLGVYQIAFSYFMVFMTIIASGLPLIISRQIATGGRPSPRLTRNSTDPSTDEQKPHSQIVDSAYRPSTSRIVTAGLVISLVASVIIILSVFVLRGPISGLFADTRAVSILLVLIPAILAFSIYTVLRAVWWGQRKFFLLGATELVEQVARVVIFLLLLSVAFLFPNLAIAAALAFTLGCVVAAGAVVWIYARQRRQEKRVGAALPPACNRQSNEYRNLLKTATPITAVRVITTIALPIIATILPARLIAAGWSSSAAIAHFGIAVGMVLPLLSIPQTVISALSTALVPELSRAKEQGDHESIQRKIRNCIRFTLFVNFMLIPVFMAVGGGLGRFLFAEPQAGVYLIQSAWIMVPLSLSLITNAILNSLGGETRAMMHYVIGSVFLFASVWILPQFIGVGALIVGIGVCTAIASVLNVALIAKKTRADLGFITQMLGYIIITIPAVLIGRFLFGAIDNVMPLFFSMSIAGAVTMAVFLVLAWMFKLVELEHLKVRLQKKSPHS